MSQADEESAGVVRVDSDPPVSEEGYDAPTRVGEAAYAMLARNMAFDGSAVEQHPPPPPAPTPVAAHVQNRPTPLVPPAHDPVSPEPRWPSAPPPAVRSRSIRTEIAIAVASFLVVAVPAILYVFLR